MKRFRVVVLLFALLSLPAVVGAQYDDPSGGGASGGGGSSGGGIQVGGGRSSGGMAPGRGAVSIIDFAFQPVALFISAGESVEWTNGGNAPHTVDSNSERFESGVLDAGGHFRYTFDAPGVYPYHCDIHPQMRGMVVVTGA
jgi:plastocyanin